MAIRIRRIDGFGWVALCAAETDELPGDIYLDDGVHHALSAKFAQDWQGQTVDWQYDEEWAAMETQKLRDAKEELNKWLAEEAKKETEIKTASITALAIVVVTMILVFLIFVPPVRGQPSADNTRVPPAAGLNVPTTTYTDWRLGKPDPVSPGYFHILKSGISLGAPRARELAYCQGDIYAMGRPTSGKGGWWRIAADLLWTNTVTLPCDVVIPPSKRFDLSWLEGAILADRSNEPAVFKVYRDGAFHTDVAYPINTYRDTVPTPSGLTTCYEVSAADLVEESPKTKPVCVKMP